MTLLWFGTETSGRRAAGQAIGRLRNRARGALWCASLWSACERAVRALLRAARQAFSRGLRGAQGGSNHPFPPELRQDIWEGIREDCN